MTTYTFRYSNATGGTIRSTAMQCETDDEAVRKALALMHDTYFSLEIFEDERCVYERTIKSEPR